MAEVQREGTFKRLVRSLSRSSGRPHNVALPTDKQQISRPSDSQRSGNAALSTSPPPDSYFPPPPSATLRDDEASGRGRHPESLGARADALGGSNHGAPGVSFAPSVGTGVVRPTSELDAWNPPPRRTQSQRVRPSASKSTGGLNGNGRGRATTVGDRVLDYGDDQDEKEGGAGGVERLLAPGERKGVQLEDKVLSRRTSVKRAASAVKRAVEAAGFVPVEKVEGEKRVLILVADGSEEIEVMTPFDVFVRASLNPVLVSVSPLFSPSQSLPYVTLSRGARILADTQFETLKQEYKDNFDAIIIPGGAKGAERLSKEKSVQELIWSFYESGKLVGMICAGSLAAKTSGIAEGARITSHPSVKGDLEKMYDYSEDRVVISDNLVTSRGPGTALEFSLAIVEILAGKRKRDEVAEPMIL